MFSSSGASFLSGRGGAGGGRGHCMGGISVDGGEVSKKTIGWRGALPMHPHTMGNPVHECLNRLKHCYLHMANLSLFLMSICSGYHSFSTKAKFSAGLTFLTQILRYCYMNDSLCQFSLVSFNYFDWRVIKDYWFQSETSYEVQLKYGVSRNLHLSKD